MAETAETSIPPTKEKLDELVKSAGLQYSLKNFAGAAELYSKATEIQGQLNGEMAPENAELLYYYGRALYKVAIATSDVLGNKVAQEEKKKPKAGKQAKAESSGAAASGAKTEAKGETVESKPYFQLTGDENWTDSEDEEEDAEAEGAAEGEEEQDDFGNAFEAFDIARVLYTKQLEGLDAHDGVSKGKGKAEISPRSKLVRERLADCYNYLVDIAFENENFHSAVADARSALEIQQEFLDISHQYITEAHYKLSLALEFASVSKVREEQAGMQVGDSDKAKESEAEIDYELRKEAAQQMELAIQSLESRIKKEQAEASNLPKDKKKEKESSIKDGQEMLEDMKTRLVDLQADPNQQLDPTDGIDQSVFQGILGGLLGADPTKQKAVLEEAKQSANDISGIVRTKKKEKAPVAASSAAASSAAADSSKSGKRKLVVKSGERNGKRAKTEDI